MCQVPAATEVAPLTPLAATGTALAVVEPSPRPPFRLTPQHQTSPPAVATQLWFTPTASDVASVSPTTSTGVALGSTVPSPSWPSSDQPQHRTPPVLRRAQVWNPRLLTATSVRPARW